MDSEKVRHILVRHEQGAGHAAEGYARRPARSASAWRPPAPARPTSSPHRRRLHGLGADRRDHRPGAQHLDRHRRLPGSRHRGITMPITKHNYLVTNPDEIPRCHRRGVPHRRHRAPGARCSSTSARTPWSGKPPSPGRRDRPARLPAGHEAARQADQGGRQAHRRGRAPGASTSAAASSARTLRRAARTRRADPDPVVTTLMARGAFPDSHPQHLGMPGMHGTVPRCRRCRSPTCSSPSAPASTTGSPASCRLLRPDAKVIHADIDPAEIGKNRHADVPIVGDARTSSST
jgi:acetolactate synthase-1/2/3 large subunit